MRIHKQERRELLNRIEQEVRHQGESVVSAATIAEHYVTLESARTSIWVGMRRRLDFRFTTIRGEDGSLIIRHARCESGRAWVGRRVERIDKPREQIDAHASFYQELVAKLVTRRTVTVRDATLRARFAGIPAPWQRITDELGRRGLHVTHTIDADGSLRLRYSNFARTG